MEVREKERNETKRKLNANTHVINQDLHGKTLT